MAVLLFSLLLPSPSSPLPLCLSLLADAPLSMPLGSCLCLPLRAALVLPLQTVANLQHMHKGRTVKGEGCGRMGGGRRGSTGSTTVWQDIWSNSNSVHSGGGRGRGRGRQGETLSLDGHVCLFLPFPRGKGRVCMCVCAMWCKWQP